MIWMKWISILIRNDKLHFEKKKSNNAWTSFLKSWFDVIFFQTLSGIFPFQLCSSLYTSLLSYYCWYNFIKLFIKYFCTLFFSLFYSYLIWNKFFSVVDEFAFISVLSSVTDFHITPCSILLYYWILYLQNCSFEGMLKSASQSLTKWLNIKIWFLNTF